MAHRSVRRRRRPIILFTSFNQAATLQRRKRERGPERQEFIAKCQKKVDLQEATMCLEMQLVCNVVSPNQLLFRVLCICHSRSHPVELLRSPVTPCNKVEGRAE